MASQGEQVAVTTATPIRLWQTSTGIAPDPETTLAGSATPNIFRAGTFNDPVPIVITNTDGTNRITLGGTGVTDLVGTVLLAGESITRNVIGNDSEYAIAHGGTVNVGVEVSRT